MSDRVATAPTSSWLDPEEHRPPRGTRMLLLTRWGVAVIGEWIDDGYAAWAPLPKVPRAIKARMR